MSDLSISFGEVLVVLVILYVIKRFFIVDHCKNTSTLVLYEQKHFHGFEKRVSSNIEMRKQTFELTFSKFQFFLLSYRY
jgi:hypothetical protein